MAIREAEEGRTRVAEQQGALLRIARLVAAEARHDVLFAAVSEAVGPLLGVQAASVLRFVGDERAVVVGVWREGGKRGLPVNAEVDFDRRNSALGRAHSTRRPARVDNYEGARGELPLMMKLIDVRSSVAAPVLVGGEPWGAVVVSTTEPEPLPADSEERLAEFAGLVGLALANGESRRRLADSRRRIVEAADESRRRLEHDLHEGAQQHLVALTLKLRVARARASPELAELLDDALVDALETNVALSDLARALHPAVLTERGLNAALQALAARVAVPVHLRELPGRRFPPMVETTAYVVVCDVLANVVEHAHATEARVAVADGGDMLRVEVSDDGIGGARLIAGRGLRNLADRAAAVGGGLEVESPRGEGTIVRVDIPVER